MGTFQKILTTSLWGMTVLMMIFIVTAGVRIKQSARHSADLAPVMSATSGTSVAVPAIVLSNNSDGLQNLFDAPAFSLVDQDGKPFSNADLKGSPWISEFVFTNCQSICPVMMAKMAGLQKTMDKRMQFVSFSVDPDRDRPAVLKAKAAELSADLTRWHWLTNPDGDLKSIDAVMRGMFQATPSGHDAPTMHSDKFFLFDAAGHCRGVYSSADPDAMVRLNTESATLLAERP